MKLPTQVRRAYKATPLYALDRLIAEETKWKRKVTIASNKLAHVRRLINKLAKQLAQP